MYGYYVRNEFVRYLRNIRDMDAKIVNIWYYSSWTSCMGFCVIVMCCVAFEENRFCKKNGEEYVLGCLEIWATRWQNFKIREWEGCV